MSKATDIKEKIALPGNALVNIENTNVLVTQNKKNTEPTDMAYEVIDIVEYKKRGEDSVEINKSLVTRFNG